MISKINLFINNPTQQRSQLLFLIEKHISMLLQSEIVVKTHANYTTQKHNDLLSMALTASLQPQVMPAAAVTFANASQYGNNDYIALQATH